MISGKVGRLLVAVALAATFFLALPAQAADGQGSSPGLFERLAAWVVDGWDGWMRGASLSMSGATGVDRDGGHLDPNGGPRNGSCAGDGGCDHNPPASKPPEGRP